MKTILLLNGLLLLALLWLYSLTAKVDEQYEIACEDRRICLEIANMISKAKAEAQKTGLAPANYDCSREIHDLVSGHGIKAGVISSRDSSLDDDVAVKTVGNPVNEPVSLKQIVGVIDSGYQNEVCYFTDGLRISREKNENLAGETELWVVEDFRFKFLSESGQ